jgi:hypothetical protein
VKLYSTSQESVSYIGIFGALLEGCIESVCNMIAKTGQSKYADFMHLFSQHGGIVKILKGKPERECYL